MPRPLPVTVIAWLLIATGAMGFVYHLTEFRSSAPFEPDFLAIEFVRLLAVVAGVFLLKGAGWARWLALAWMAFHVAISFDKAWPQVAMHSLFLIAFAFFLLQPAATRYFRRESAAVR
jgi:hypothetical protein